MAWLRFFCSTSSLLVLMQMPMLAGWEPRAATSDGEGEDVGGRQRWAQRVGGQSVAGVGRGARQAARWW